jgi:hypothetical protein
MIDFLLVEHKPTVESAEETANCEWRMVGSG